MRFPVKIRAATEADAPGLAAMVHQMKEVRPVLPESLETMTGIVTVNIRKASETGTSTVYVAETADEEIAGYCAVHWTPFVIYAGGEGYVSELFVRPSDAGHGIGSRLLEMVVADGRKRGCTRLSLLNGRDGESYRRNFYAQRGWVERERMANFILPLIKGTKNG